MPDGAWLYYREKASGDYLMARRKPFAKNSSVHEALAANVDGQPKTVSWTMVSGQYLAKDCELVDEAIVPDDWMEWFDKRWAA